MTATKKSLRFVTVFTLIFAMVLSFTSVPAFADGTETWNWGFNICSSISISGGHTSPVKTMGTDGKLILKAQFTPTDITDSSNPVLLIVQVRDLAGNVLSGNSYLFEAPLGWTYVSTSLNVYKGQQVRIYVAAVDSVTLGNRSATVKYTGQLV